MQTWYWKITAMVVMLLSVPACLSTLGSGSSVVANDDDATTFIDTPISIDVLRNDDTDRFIVNLFEDVAADADNIVQGTLEIDSSGHILFRPQEGFEGVVIFTYSITGAGVAYILDSSDRATVTVTVTSMPVEDEMEPDDAEPGEDSGNETDPPVTITSATGCPEFVAYYNSLDCIDAPLSESNTCSESIAETCDGVLAFNTCRIENTLCVTDGSLFESGNCIDILTCE